MFYDRPEAGRRALLVQLKQASNDVEFELSELTELARSAELEPVVSVTASRETPHPKTFVGPGKVDEIRHLLEAEELDLLLVNHELSAGQQRNLEAELGCRVVPRTELILHIFADRARTHEGKLQVELAHLEHAQTRLVRGWTHLDRQKGGIGLRGAGETQIEMDQRMLAERIKALKAKLTTVASRRAQGRRRRSRAGTPVVALVGYTNAGKSTLFNALTDAAVLAEDRLFATLDPTMRSLQMPGIGDVVLADTVGFISQLPHALVDAFKATLEEVAGADLLLQVVDASDEDRDLRIDDVNAVLREIGALDLPRLIVYNKADLLSDEDNWLPADDAHLAVSALTGAGLPELLARIGRLLGAQAPVEVLLSPSEGRLRSWLYQRGAVVSEDVQEDGSMALTIVAREEVLRAFSDQRQAAGGAAH